MTAGVTVVWAPVLVYWEGEEQQYADELHQEAVSSPESACDYRNYSGEKAHCTVCYKNEPLNCLNLVLRGALR